MNIQIEILAALSVFGLLSFIVSVFSYLSMQKLKTLAKYNNKQIIFLEDSLFECEKELEKNRIRVENQSRFLSSLENSAPKPKELKEETFDAATQRESSEINLTEQKHKVLSLAQNGQDSRSIAEKLGMMPGEVELIVNLNRPLQSYS